MPHCNDGSCIVLGGSFGSEGLGRRSSSTQMPRGYRQQQRPGKPVWRAHVQGGQLRRMSTTFIDSVTAAMILPGGGVRLMGWKLCGDKKERASPGRRICCCAWVAVFFFSPELGVSYVEKYKNAEEAENELT